MTAEASHPAISVVDAHTHIFPPELARDRGGHLKRDVWFESLYQNPKALIVTAEELIASMDAAGIERSVACGFPWSDPGLCREHNAYLADAARRFPNRISWLGIVAPGSPSLAEEARWCFEQGASGLGELNADAQGFDFRDVASLAALAEIAVAAGRPIMTHASEPVGHVYPGKGAATPDKLLAFLAEFPQVRLVAAHWGGGLPFYELMPEVAEIARRVVYDTAASTYLYRFQVFRSVLDIIGSERVLFASDYPVLKQRRFVERTLATEWRSEEERAAVFGGNARRVYRLPDRGESA
jgi:predicted TIM-barrel fold metal-dependent hydrolase